MDEIQAKPDLFAKLRWFYEYMPELPVIAAGSLLEFVLGSYPMSMPVGRVSYAYLEPLSFIEFLEAQKKEQLIDLIRTFSWNKEINTVIHEELMRLFREYVYEAVFLKPFLVGLRSILLMLSKIFTEIYSVLIELISANMEVKYPLKY